MLKSSWPCFDAGSDYCPCILAHFGQCVSCSMLRGDVRCDCGWNGICVYDEFTRNRQSVKPGRQEIVAIVIERKEIANNGNCRAFWSRLSVTPNLARWSVFPGSFVLLRPRGTREAFNVPISIMETSEDGALEIAVEVQGIKTTALEQALQVKQEVLATGPFWSGLQGYSLLTHLGAKNILVITKGMGQAPVPLIARYIVHRGGNVKIMVGPGKLGQVFITENLQKLKAPFEVLPKATDHNLERYKQEIETGNYDLLISAGSSLQHQGILELLAKSSLHRKVPHFLWTSPLRMTCAEGICGSCLVSGFRGCKAQFDGNFKSGFEPNN